MAASVNSMSGYNNGQLPKTFMTFSYQTMSERTYLCSLSTLPPNTYSPAQ